MEQAITLSKQRKGEIALVLLAEDFKRKQHTLLKTDILKKIGNISKELLPFGISKEEIIILYRDIIHESIQIVFDQEYFWEGTVSGNNGSLSLERKGEIALQCWKISVTAPAVSLDKDYFNRKLGNLMQTLSDYDISKEEVKYLHKEALQEAIMRMFDEVRTM